MTRLKTSLTKLRHPLNLVEDHPLEGLGFLVVHNLVDQLLDRHLLLEAFLGVCLFGYDYKLFVCVHADLTCIQHVLLFRQGLEDFHLRRA